MQLDPNAFLADPELIAVLDKKAPPVICDSERVLFMQGDPPAGLYILRKGVAQLTMDSTEGKPIVSMTASAGSLLGLPGMVANRPYTLTAKAEAGAVIGFIPREEFTALMESEPMLAFKIVQVLAAQVRSARSAIG